VSVQHLSVVEGAGHRGAWAELWERDRWRQSELPNGDLSSTYRGDRIVNFARLRQPWLKEAAKRWTRARVLAGTSISSVSAYVGDLAAFSNWLAAARPEVVTPAMISREVIEDYMLWVRTETLKAATRARYIGSLRMLLDEQREDGLTGMPKAAVIHGAEIPRPDYRVPKALGDDVFSQLVDPSNLALLRYEHHRTVVLLLAYTGFRVSSIVTLTRGPLAPALTASRTCGTSTSR
jgi:site-specific recombinase XerD